MKPASQSPGLVQGSVVEDHSLGLLERAAGIRGLRPGGWGRWILAGLGCALILHILVCVLIDPFGVIGWVRLGRPSFEQNTRYLKIEHLLQDRSADAFILGSSRVNAYRTEQADRLTGRRFYNLSVSSDHIETLRQRTEWLLETRPVREVVVGLDYDMQFLVKPPRQREPVLTEHPAISGRAWVWTFLRALQPQSGYWFQRVRLEWLEPWKNSPLDIATGQWRGPDRSREPGGEAAFWGKAASNQVSHRNARFRHESLEELQRLVESLRRSGVRATFLINPVHRSLLATFDPQDYARWRQAVRQVCGVCPDPGEDLGLVDRRGAFLDPGHLTPEAGDNVLKQVLGGRSGSQ